MIGEKFTRLTVIGFSHKDQSHRKWWNCICDCGKEKVLHTGNLRSGNTKSCGCFAKDSSKGRALPNDRGVINHIILQYKRHAKDRGLVFDLSYELVDSLVRGSCHYCGVTGGNLKKTKNLIEGFRHNGIDRVDSSKNYTLENVVSCCGDCNKAKRDMTAEAFISMASRIHLHQLAMAAQWGKVELAA